MEYAEKSQPGSPHQPPFMDTLAMLLAEKGETVKAIELLRKLWRSLPRHSHSTESCQGSCRGWQEGRGTQELEALAKLGDKFPSQAEVGNSKRAINFPYQLSNLIFFEAG